MARMLDSGAIDEAIRFSAETLADADERWTESRNSGAGSSEALARRQNAGGWHVEALMLGGYDSEAFATALMLLLGAAIDQSRDNVIDASHLKLFYLALSAFNRLSPQLEANPDAAIHAPKIIGYLASLLYDVYRRVAAGEPSNPYLRPSYELLTSLQPVGAIQWPEVDVNGTPVGVDRPADIIGDAVGRSRALRLLDCD